VWLLDCGPLSLSSAQETEAKLKCLLKYRRAEEDIPNVSGRALVKVRYVKYLVHYTKYPKSRFMARPRLRFIADGPVLTKYLFYRSDVSRKFVIYTSDLF